METKKIVEESVKEALKPVSFVGGILAEAGKNLIYKGLTKPGTKLSGGAEEEILKGILKKK